MPRLLLACLLLAAVAVAASGASGGGGGAQRIVIADDYDDDVQIQPQQQETAAEDEDIAKKAPPTTPEAEPPARRPPSPHLDDEEFEGVAEERAAAPSTTEEAAQKQNQQQQQQQPQPAAEKKRPPKTWRTEAAFGAVFVAFAAWFVLGKRANDALATAFIREHRGLLSAHFGAADAALTRESYARYSCRATGRVGVRGVRCVLDLQRRQEPAAWLAGLVLGWRDTLSVDVQLRAAPAPEPFLLALCRQSAPLQKRLLEENPDVAALAGEKPRAQTLLPPGVVAYTDCGEAMEALLTPDVARALAVAGDLFESLVLTDGLTSAATSKHAMRVVLRLPAAAEMRRLDELLRVLIVGMADSAAALRLGKLARARGERLRAEAQVQQNRKTQQERAEAAQKAKEEKKQKELEALSPEARERRLEKERKLEQQRAMHRRVQLVKH